MNLALQLRVIDDKSDVDYSTSKGIQIYYISVTLGGYILPSLVLGISVGLKFKIFVGGGACHPTPLA